MLQARERLHVAGAPPGARPGAAPTRELADQVAQQVKLYAKYTKLRSAVVFGGIDMKPQTLELKEGVEVLVATPGRLLDHIEAKNAVLNQVEYVVLDEADRMLDIGFLPDLQRILSYLPKQRTDAAVLGHLLARDQAPGQQLPAGPGHDRGGAAQRHGLHRGAALLQRRRRRQAPRACTRCCKTRGIKQAFVFVNSKLGCARLARSLRARRPEDHGAARRQEPGRAPEGAGRLQGRRGRSAGGHRRGGARPGHQRPAGGVQFRRARSTPKTTCTASAAPAAPAPPAWR